MNRVSVLSAVVAAALSLPFAENAYAEAQVEYGAAVDAAERAAIAQLGLAASVDPVVELINHQFRLPQTLRIRFGAEDGPLYDPDDNTILVPYGFVLETRERFAQADYHDSGVSANQATRDALMHTLLHEFAHAAIALYDLPVLGREEDAADALATLLLIEYVDDGGEVAITAADLFDLESGDREVLDDEDFWDEHSLDAQRFFSTLCQVYGSDPQEYGHLVEQEYLSPERAELCIEEYEVLARSWFGLLAPHMNHPATAAAGSEPGQH